MLPVFSPDRELTTYDLRFGADHVRYVAGVDCVDSLARLLADELADCPSVLMLIDAQARAHAERLQASMPDDIEVVTVLVEAGERNKRLALVDEVLEQAVQHRIGRRSRVLAMGGGLTGNIAGMVAALLYRGLPLIHLPTTPVAAFDSVLSAKQAVNLRQGKNLCGTYLTPSLIACDLAWLLTVPPGQMVVGFAEMAKNVLAVLPGERERFTDALSLRHDSPHTTLATLLDIGIAAKAGFLAKDPHERHEALVFEYGHTVGHAMEFAAPGILPHGEAVAWGMLIAADLATEFCGLPESDRAEHHRICAHLGLDQAKLSKLDLDLVKRLLRSDNKRGYLQSGVDMAAMVLLQSLGRPALTAGKPLVAVPIAAVESALDDVVARYTTQ